MNFDYWLRRLSGKATCHLQGQVTLTPTARIRNIRGDSSAIRVGGNSVVSGELLVFAHGGDISIGAWSYIGEGSRIWSACSVKIGERVLVAHNVNIFDSLTHPLNARLRHEQFVAILQSGHPRSIDLGERPVVLGNDVWVGANASVLRGVTVGDGAIVGAGAVVVHDVAPYCIVAGNPATVVRELRADER